MKILKGKSLAPEVNLSKWINESGLNYLEIGCYDGYNLAILADIFPSKKIFGIDPFINDGWVPGQKGNPLIEQKQNLLNNISSYKNINFTEATAESFLNSPPYSFEEMDISCIFVDGAHIYDFILIDIELSIKCILSNKNKAGIIIFHDTHVQDVRTAIESFKKKLIEKGMQIESYFTEHAYAVFKVKVI